MHLNAKIPACLECDEMHAMVRTDECSPSGCSKSSSSRFADFSNGLSRSQSIPSTLAITSFSGRDFEISLATSIGVVSQLIPVFAFPSLSVMVISCRACAIVCRVSLVNPWSSELTLDKLVVFRFILVEDCDSRLEELGLRGLLTEVEWRSIAGDRRRT